MLLPPTDAADFLEAYQKLITLVSGTSPSSFEEWAQGRDSLLARWETFENNPEAAKNPLFAALPDALYGRFCFLKRYKGYCAMQHLDTEAFFAVHALTTPLEKIVPEFTIVEACLLPFRGRVVCDGLVRDTGVRLGKNMMGEIRTAYQAAKRNGELIQEIQTSSQNATSAPGKPEPTHEQPSSDRSNIPSALAQQLSGKTKKDLITFIEQLADRSEEAAQIVDLFLQRDKPSKLAKKLRRMIAKVRNRRSFISYSSSSSVARELHAILDTLEQDLLPHEPLAALKTLQVFIESDADILNNADDSNGSIGDTFHRACALFGQASLAAGRPPEAAEIFFSLREGDGYGTRDTLYEQTASIFPPKELEKLIQDWREKAKQEALDDFSGVRIRLAQIGESIGDPELHEEASLCGRPIDQFPMVALDVARVYLACDKPEIALQKIPSEKACRHQTDRSELLIQVHQTLGNHKAVAAEYEKLFAANASPSIARCYLATLPETEREQTTQRLNQQVLQGEYSPLTQAIYFAKMHDIATAAEIIEQNADSFEDAYYEILLDLGEDLGDVYPLALTVLYRANLNPILERANSRYYHHAVRYAHQLEDLAKQISDWKQVPPHQTYWTSIQQKHKRKYSFWNQYEGK